MLKTAFLCVFLLFGCSYTTATNNSVLEAKNALKTIKETLPTECRTKDIENRFAEVSKKVENITVSCKADVKAVKKTNDALWGVILVLIIALVVVAKK